MAAEENIIVMNSTDANGNKVEGPKVLPLTDVLGSYSILADSSQVVFSLGKNGVTKGKFKKVAGTMTLAEDPTQSALKVVLEMKDFTTFNGMRDESLRGSDYFNVDKFPKMTYQVKGFADKGNDEYEATGDFTMLGVTKPIKVTLQRVEVGDRLILIGSGTIDRTEFGMAPSAAEGNVVSFNYQVELVQK